MQTKKKLNFYNGRMKRISRVISSSLIASSLLASPAMAADQAILEEIIVTATKREQNVRDVSSVVNVVGGADIEKLAVFNFDDLERVTSGLQLTQVNPRNATIALRGVTVDPESGSESAVDVYHNNVSQRNDNIFGALFDLERVEVLKGPQGSIQGATSPGGAIFIHTKKPNLQETEGYVRGTVSGGVDGSNIQAAFNVPLVADKLALRIAAVDDRDDVNNVVNGITGNAQDSETTSYRASLRWQPNDNFEANLVYQNNDQLVLGTPQLAGERTGASAFAGVAGVPCEFVAASGGDVRSCRSIEPSDRLALASIDAATARESDIVTLNVDWDIGDHTLSYVYGYTDSIKSSMTPNDASFNFPLQLNFLSNLGVTSDTDYITNQSTITTVDADVHEIRFASSDNPVWNYMVGAYVRDQNTVTEFEAFTAIPFIPLSIANTPLTPVRFTGGHVEGVNFSTGGAIPFNSKTEAIFTAHEFQLSETLKLEAALRYQEVDRFNEANILFGAFNQPERISIQNVSAVSNSPFIPPAAVPGVANQIAGLVLQGTLDQISSTDLVGVPEEFQNPTDEATTGRIALNYEVNDALSTYISYSESFRQGGISITPGETLGVADLLYDSETSDAIELGMKGVFLDGAAEVNVALYNQNFDGFLGYVVELDYVNIQGVVEPLTGGLVFNGDAKTVGLDLDWRLATSQSWLCEQVGRCESSSRIAGTPELTAVLFGEYVTDIAGRQFFARGNAKYNDGIVATRAVEFGDSAGETDSYVLLDLFFGLRADNWEVSAYIKNILDDDADLDLTNPGDGFDVNNDFFEVRQLQPRSYGVTVQYSF